MKIKIYHIHTDFKFIHNTLSYDDNLFDNKIIFIGLKQITSDLDYFFFNTKNKDLIQKVIKEINDADLIVVYGLCEIKKEIVRNIHTNAKIIWRFFGYELYGKRKDLMYSIETYHFLEQRMFFLELIRSFKRKFTDFKDRQIIKKIDYISVFSEEEYDFLSRYWNVPKFLPLNIPWIDKQESKQKKKEQIILGNSQSPYNNHLEVLKILEQNPNSDLKIIMFFSYGAGEKYRKLIKDRASTLTNAELIEDFLDIETFNKYYDESAAIVINSYRQFALGNVFTAFRNGVKVYLNPKNVTMEWLRNEGVLVYDIEDFENDLKTNNIYLSPSQMEINKEAVLNMQRKLTKNEFNQQIVKILQD